MYRFTGECDTGCTYIGETKRHLGIRVDEHLTGTGVKLTAIGTHLRQCNICSEAYCDGKLGYNNFEVIRSGTSKLDVQIYEALLIKRLQPSLNLKMHNSGMSFTLRLFG